MRPVTLNVVIDKAPTAVYDYLLDIANHGEFADHLLTDLRLTRVESYGKGASMRFRIGKRLRDRLGGLTITETEAGRRLLLSGSTGRIGRVPMQVEYLIEPLQGSMTRLSVRVSTWPAKSIDRVREFGLRIRLRRGFKRGLGRLRDLLEGSPRARRGRRPTVAGLDSHYVSNP